MLERKIYRKLDEWKRTSDKKALCIIGARQIGKTTIIREFAKKIMSIMLKLILS